MRMLSLLVRGEVFDEERQMFFSIEKPVRIILEHSLLSISKWESIWRIPFFPAPGEVNKKTAEQYSSYIKCMTINKGVPDESYLLLTKSDYETINNYVDSDQTATWFSNRDQGTDSDRTATTSELIYYYMTAQQIPWEAEKWHLSRLFALIRICSIKNGTDTHKMSKSEILSRNLDLNEQRKKAMGTRG